MHIVAFQQKKTGNRSRWRRKNSRARKDNLRFIPLGGLGEIGKNMFALEYDRDIIVVDAGLMFPEDEMLGIDFVIPDTSYLEKNRDRVRAFVITHGHEDHIGALPFVLPKIDVPVYGTALTIGLIEHKLEEAVPSYRRDLREIHAGELIEIGVFKIKPFAVCHSIPDGVGLAIDTPLGVVLHTGDIKLDTTPVDGRLTDFSAISEASRKGVILMLSDSTNVEKEGFTPSESIIGKTLENLFRANRTKRIVLSAFASNLHRIQQIINTASKFNRKITFLGRSMVGNVEIASRLGYLQLDEKMVVPATDIDRLPPNKLVILTTGSQGEPFSGLVLMSRGQHRNISLGSSDVVAVFATPVPGNEKMVSNTINHLFKCGCEVIYEKDRDIHVSGHASREELKILINMVKPEYFVPVHGEYRHLVRHAQLAQEVGIPGKNIFLLEKGEVLSITSKMARVLPKVDSGGVLVDGMVLGELEGSAMRERRSLSEDGAMVVSLVIDGSGRLVSPPVFESRGFIHMEDAHTLREELADAVQRLVNEEKKRKGGIREDSLKMRLMGRMGEVLRKYGRSRPIIIILINWIEK
ncbi:MAG: ribonuclease J [Synergistales bacterium]|nr:ribonuclease J [Synergistales bacterium]